MPRKRTTTSGVPGSARRNPAHGGAASRGSRRSPAGDVPPVSPPEGGRPSRLIIEDVRPEIDSGRFPIKRVVGDEVVVEATAYADGHDVVRCQLLHRSAEEEAWQATEMEALGSDRWRASFRVLAIGWYVYTVRAWVDPFTTWKHDLEKRVLAGQNVIVELRVGAALVSAAADRAPSQYKAALRAQASTIAGDDVDHAIRAALSSSIDHLVDQAGPGNETRAYPRELRVWVDRVRARFSAWYELFPRSCSDTPGQHGTFTDLIKRLPYIAGMGFDVLYLPPIHPIGHAHRRGPDNTPSRLPSDPGSPWAIGSEAGGHLAINPRLGTIEQFRRLLAAARAQGLEVALDVAFQCSPDHPYVREHPDWFRQRPDGSIRHAENPPKKYEDIVPFDFDCEDWRGLWSELLGVVLYWAREGIRIFRIDNPHTKPIRFWEWLIDEVRSAHPETLFLSEAFTRPSVMYQLAKVGFTQSYTYFTWRNTSREIEDYFRELTGTDVAEYLRPNLWPNTPDILPAYLQFGGPAAFKARLILAATLGANYGIYGPAFELCVAEAREADSEEYAHSEKYEVRAWDLDADVSLRELITLVNTIRREYPALQTNEGLRFHTTGNDQLICYSKGGRDSDTAIVTVVNLDPHNTQSGWIHLAPADVGVVEGDMFQVHDLLSGARYLWHGDDHYVELDPHAMPAHILAVRKKVRRERDFDYYA